MAGAAAAGEVAAGNVAAGNVDAPKAAGLRSLVQLQSPQWIAPAAIAWGVFILILLWVARDRLGGWGWIGIAARSLAVAALLFCLCKPTILRPADAARGGEWLVLVDQSRSMSIADPARSPAECVAVADAIGAIPQGARPIVGADLSEKALAIAPLFDAVDTAQSEVEYARLSGHGAVPAIQRFDAAMTSLREGLTALASLAGERANTTGLLAFCHDLIAQIDRNEKMKPSQPPQWRPRLTLAPQMLARAASTPQDAADASLYRDDAAIRDAADAIAQTSRIDLVARAIEALRSRLPSEVQLKILGAAPSLPQLDIGQGETPIAADGVSSDIGGAIDALRRGHLDDNTQAVLLFSDGRQVGGTMRALPLDVPLMTIDPAVRAPSDVAVTQIEAPTWTYAGETLPIRVGLRCTALHGQPVDITIDGSAAPIHRRVTPPDGRSNYKFIVAPAEQAGVMRLSVQASTSPPDLLPANDQMRRAVRVCGDRVGVTLIAGPSSNGDADAWRTVLSEANWIDLNRSTFGTSRPTSARASDWPDGQDVIVLDDIAMTQLDAAHWARLARWVQERHGGLIFIAGENQNPATLDAIRSMQRLWPWREDAVPQWRDWPAAGVGFHLTPPDGSPLARLSADQADPKRSWEQLPPVPSALLMSAVKGNLSPLLIDAESGAAAMTLGHVGNGRVIFIGTDESMRWRGRLDSTDPDRLWLDLIRTAAEQPYPARDVHAGLDVEPPIIPPAPAVLETAAAQPATVRVARFDNGPTPRVEAWRDGVLAGRIELHAVANGSHPDRFTGTFSPTTPGNYEIRLLTTAGEPALSLPETVKPNFDAEMVKLNPDDGYLRRLSRASGGEALRLQDVPSLPQRLEEISARSPKLQSYDLWDSTPLFVFVVGCLGLEWANRKWIGWT